MEVALQSESDMNASINYFKIGVTGGEDESKAESEAEQEAEAELSKFMHDYYCAPGGKSNWKIQAPHLARLANRYRQRYQDTGNWTDLLQAHALYNSVAVRLPEEDEIWTQKVTEVQQLFWEDDLECNYNSDAGITSKLTQYLQQTRDATRAQLIDVQKLVHAFAKSKLNDADFVEQFCSRVKEISLYCTSRMIELAKMVFEFSVSRLSDKPPCSLCVVAIGSIARGEATPYSDLEYLFLIEHKNAHAVRYFESLAMVSYFVIGNLRESKLSYMAISELQGWFEDKQKNGFKIDGLAKGAGNIPTGNGSSNAKNHLIVTPAELLKRYKDILHHPKKEEASRGDLTAMLQYTKLIYSNGTRGAELLNEFIDKKSEIQPNDKRNDANLDMFRADAEKHEFKPVENLIKNGFSINAKRELYRYPSILLLNISILLGFSDVNSWETLKHLRGDALLSSSVHSSISFLLACACYLRLSAYLHYDSQDDRLSVLPISKFPVCSQQSMLKVAKRTGERWYISQELFNKHCELSIPLRKHIAMWKTKDIRAILKSNIEPAKWLITFQMYHCSSRWSEAQSHLQSHLQELLGDERFMLQEPERTINAIKSLSNDFQEFWNTMKALTYILGQHRQDNEALSYHLIIQRMIEGMPRFTSDRDIQLIMADVKTETGDCYYGLNQYEEAEKEYKGSLEICGQYHHTNHELLVKIHWSLGRCYNMMYKYLTAVDHLLKALQRCHENSSREVQYDYYGNEIWAEDTSQSHLVDLCLKPAVQRLIYLTNPSMILSLVIWELGTIYCHTKRYRRAFLYFDKSREMFMELYGNDACHKDIANILYSLGCASDMLNEHENSVAYWKRARLMTIQLYGEENIYSTTLRFVVSFHSETAVKAFLTLKRFKVAHSECAMVINRYGLHLLHCGHHRLAKKVLCRALDMLTEVSKSHKYTSYFLANTLSLIGVTNAKIGNIKAAEKRFKEALAVLNKFPLKVISTDLEKAELFQNMGEMYEEVQQYERARTCYCDARDKYRIGTNDSSHPKHAETESQIRQVESKLSRQEYVQPRQEFLNCNGLMIPQQAFLLDLIPS